jgi:hypothetical protein
MQYLPIDQNRVKELIKQCKHLNIFPLRLSHYFPSEEHNPVSDLIAELVDDYVQYLSIMGDEELDSFTSNLPSWGRIFIDYSPDQSHDSVLLERISLYYIVAVMQEQYFTFSQNIAGDINDSEILKALPRVAIQN